MHSILRRHVLKFSLSRNLCGHRWSSTQAAVRLQPKPGHPTHQEDQHKPDSTGLFAVEQVDGRARHLAWSNTGGITKEWRELQSGSESTGITTVSTRSSIFGRMNAGLRQMFLPTNFPQSVHRSYLPYHLLQFAECIVGTLVSVLCNQALLVSVGVSAEGSIFGAVAVQWIIKDGAGEVAKLFFIRRFSPFFDSHPKTFNLVGAGCVLFGSGLQLAALVIPATAANFLLCAAGGNIFKLIGNAVWFTTHIKFVRLFAQHGNTGDVAAKSESQASIGQLLGYAAGIGLLMVSHSAAYLYSIFAVSVPVHMVITGQMLRVAAFEMLTLPRLSQLAREYVSEPKHFVGGHSVSSLRELEAAKTTGFFGEFYKRKQDKYVRLTPKLEDSLARHGPAGREAWQICADVFENQRYLLYPDTSPKRPFSAFYAPSATADDMLQSVLHAACLRHMLDRSHGYFTKDSHTINEDQLRSALEKSLHWTSQHFPQFKSMLQSRGWRTNELAFADHGRRVLWGSHIASS